MGYFDALASASFKRDDTGNHLFFPFGAFGKGFVLPSDESVAALKRTVKRQLMVALPAVLVVVALLPTWVLFALLRARVNRCVNVSGGFPPLAV